MEAKAIYNTRRLIKKNQLGKALAEIQPLYGDAIYTPLYVRLTNIQNAYQLMVDYWKKGYPDPQRNQLYRSLLRRLDRFTNDAALLRKLTKDVAMSGTMARINAFDQSHEGVRKVLEEFVSDVAMLELETNPEQRTKAIYRDHLETMTALFECLCFSMQWHADDEEFYSQLILSPTIDSGDAQLLVSAISMAAMTHFDIHKYGMLAQVCLQATDERIRQRALVGWALTSTSQYGLYPEIDEVVGRMTSNDDIARQLLEMQMQMFFCMNAEHDREEIQRDIMPNLMKNRGFDVTRMGIVEKDDDPMEDILNPEAADRASEELEASFQRMMKMQQSGSDIYFGGFSQMKRYHFFYNLSNWFVPFYVNHPGIETTMNKLKGGKFLDNLLANGPFCDSDKYSFALAMASVVDRLPDNMKSLLDSDLAFGPTASEGVLRSASNIRLMYLQDLYRFFRLSDKRTFFFNPFGGEEGTNALFFANPVFRHTPLADQMVTLGNFLLKRKKFEALEKLLKAYPESHDSHKVCVLMGSCLVHNQRYKEAMESFEKALVMQPENRKALAALARTALQAGEFEKAEEAYARLSLIDDANLTYALGHAVALINLRKTDEATRILFRLDYEHPDNDNVTRALAWALLAATKVEQAQKEYDKLLAAEHPAPEDFLNAGYCQWAATHVEQAITLFRKFLQMAPAGGQTDIAKEMEKDNDILLANGISDFERNIMADLLG